MLSKEAQWALISWEPINSWIITARFQTTHKRINFQAIQCYAPTNNTDDKLKNNFYNQLQHLLQARKEKDILLMGDMNAKVGNNNSGYELVMGKQGIGSMNENGERFADICADNNLVIGGTVFPHKFIHKATWISPDHTTENQIDHICMNPITAGGQALEEVYQFTYLGKVIAVDGGTEEYVKTRIGKARATFNILNKIWKSKNISMKTKLRIFNSSVKTVLLYGSETWMTTMNIINKLQTANHCLRRILRIFWPNKICNINLWERTKQDTVEIQL